MTLYQTTFVINFIALMLSLWLGLYLVTRNPRAPTAWLTALTLWSLGGVFINVLLALNPPPTFQPSGLRFLFPFWPSGIFEQGANAWLQGWSVAPSIAFWHHATMLMRPGKMNTWRWTRVTFAYLVAIAAIAVQAFTQILFSVEGGDPLYLNSLQAGPLYSVFGIALIGLTTLSIINLAHSATIAPSDILRRQLMTLVTATVITGLIGPVSLLSSGLDLFPLPMVIMSDVLLIFIGMVGYGVARYSALVEKRTINRDFFYNLIGTIITVAIYTSASWALVYLYQAPRVIVILIPILAVCTHIGLNAASHFLDWLFFHGETRRLRTNLQYLRRLAGESEGMHVLLEQILGSLCGEIRATYGLILSHENGTARQIAEFHWKWSRVELPSSLFITDDFMHLDPNHFPTPLENAALLIPLYLESEQVGTLLLGHPINGFRFANADVDRLLYPTDQIAEALFLNRQNAQRLDQVAQIANKPVPAQVDPANIPIQVTENVLRNLFDFLYLADTPVAQMKIVSEQLSGGRRTHVDRGKAVHAVVMKALGQLKPDEENLPNPLTREWYPYTILQEAYVTGIQNRDIMGKLYISEGTFNRTRRAAILSLARILVEMEQLR